MEQTQIEELVNELETRVDRLRSLYEQYFMGIEKMEPHVPKKDVERRFQTLRREQIRNTALRFRFHMTLQKYNTYQSYWMRIMRQIGDGTYKRDLIRAKAAFVERRSTRPPPPVKERESEHTVDIDTFEFDDTFPGDAPTKKVDVPALVTHKGGAFDAFDEATTNLLKRAPALAADEDPTGILPLIGTGDPKKARALADPEKMRQLAAQIKAKKAGEAKPIEMKEPTPPPRAMVAEAPPIHHARKPPPLPPRPLPAATTSAAKPAAPPMTAQKPPAPVAAARPAAPPAPKPELPRPAIANSAQKPANPNDLSDTRVRQIYTQYVDTKRKQNESTAAITYEGVAKSLRESSEKLKEKLGGKAVDFEVAVKDGKTILRPKLK
ncbi:MAG: MXAN_5187 C-terminal domain-containing protein [Polyangiaceae bacterium]